MPLRSVSKENGIETILVNHSLLVFLLDRREIWQDLRWRYRREEDREAIRLICKTIDEVAKAHDEKWPDYAWPDKHKKIIKWCNSIATE